MGYGIDWFFDRESHNKADLYSRGRYLLNNTYSYDRFKVKKSRHGYTLLVHRRKKGERKYSTRRQYNNYANKTFSGKGTNWYKTRKSTWKNLGPKTIIGRPSKKGKGKYKVEYPNTWKNRVWYLNKHIR